MKEKKSDIDILEELKEWFNNFDLDSIKHKPEEYIQAISNLIAENKELKEKIENIQENFLKYNWKEATKEQIYNQVKSLYDSVF